jgi:hypothetical protein
MIPFPTFMYIFLTYFLPFGPLSLHIISALTLQPFLYFFFAGMGNLHAIAQKCLLGGNVNINDLTYNFFFLYYFNFQRVNKRVDLSVFYTNNGGSILYLHTYLRALLLTISIHFFN